MATTTLPHFGPPPTDRLPSNTYEDKKTGHLNMEKANRGKHKHRDHKQQKTDTHSETGKWKTEPEA